MAKRLISITLEGETMQEIVNKMLQILSTFKGINFEPSDKGADENGNEKN